MIRPAALLLVLLAVAPTARAQQPAQVPASKGSQPVEIVSDSLTVEQDKQLATFTGNVDAVQGEMRLRSDKLLVFYDRKPDAGQSQGQSGGGGGGDQSIRRIEAMGNVLLIQPGQTAKGDRGTYEPATGAVTLEGNVVLTRDRNVIRGARLESNQRTGMSTVFAALPGAVAKPDQRVRAVFTPAEKAAPPAAAGAATGGKAP